MLSVPDFTEFEFYTKSTECGTDCCLSPYVLMSDLQEAADEGAAAAGWGRDAIGGYNCCWIILRCRLNIIRLPSWRERFTVRTWSTGTKKLFWNREYEIFDNERNSIGKGTSVWILADKNSHRPVFPSKLTGLPQDVCQPGGLVLGQECPKLRIPPTDERKDAPLIIKYADYSELDHNHHVNNTRYIAWIYDALYKGGYDLSKINDININYLSEVRQGQKISVFAQETDEGVLVYGYREDSSGVFVSEIKFCI